MELHRLYKHSYHSKNVEQKVEQKFSHSTLHCIPIDREKKQTNGSKQNNFNRSTTVRVGQETRRDRKNLSEKYLPAVNRHVNRAGLNIILFTCFFFFFVLLLRFELSLSRTRTCQSLRYFQRMKTFQMEWESNWYEILLMISYAVQLLLSSSPIRRHWSFCCDFLSFFTECVPRMC